MPWEEFQVETISGFIAGLELIESGKVLPTDRGKDNVTALHWAAINNHIPVAQYLLDKGAEIDALGGTRFLG